MKSTRLRVILAVAAAGVALTACSPGQAGTAAIVGGDRISTGELDSNVKEYEDALAKAKVPVSELQFPGSVPQVVLFQLATAKRYIKAAEQQGITVTEAEIDQVIAASGGEAQNEQRMLQQAVAPSHAREFTKAGLMLTKLMAKYGGGSDQEALQKGQAQAIKDLESVKVTWSPRYGTLNNERSEQSPQLFVDAGRFGAIPPAERAQ
ncbi:SurA N-terminal domain-containing protein [Streptosporangium saharense]|uniref:Peptidyl-prolyl cis-trans isomerase SurA n=1 Tax=Streptosporangium saharense TaxID=1706840 RepID=A0A7W7VPT3_9ACTN|nr:SurA N-terminal domain-containing protein [Streptosporangium saharense]MBB4917834.1 peptidyl-prolyl cis-trans isomerase SurA [Streptosporangium saharense]